MGSTPCAYRVIEAAVIFAGIDIDIYCHIIAFLEIKLHQSLLAPHIEEALAAIWLVIRLKQEILSEPFTLFVLT